jgi:serine/threonine kinase PknH
MSRIAKGVSADPWGCASLADRKRGPRSGTQFGHYQLRDLLGKGGMGEVYEAYDTVKDRTVAVKLLSEELAKNQQFEERFRRESRAAARLQEPHVIPIHDWGEINGVLYIDMRLVGGEDLRGVLRREGTLTPDRAAKIVGQIASALDAAHADNLVHRDVKPENILVTADDFAYLVDFGIANNTTDPGLTSVGTAIGSYAYMAPERFESGQTTNRADIYSLACVLQECLTGKPPFPAANISVLLMAHLNESPPRPSQLRPGLTPAIDGVIARGLAKNPADRYASAGEFAHAVFDALVSRGSPTVVTPNRVDPTQVVHRPNPAPTQAYYGAPQQDWSHPPPPAQYPPQQQQQPQQPKSSIVPIMVTLLVVAILALGGVVGWLLFSKPNNDSASSPGNTSVVVPTGSNGSASVTTAPPSASTLPPGARECPSVYGQTGDYHKSAMGNDKTSCPFAEEVRFAYARGAPGQSREIKAVSPVTHTEYTMSCSPSGKFVTCVGGDNAVVYVY